MFSIPSAKDNIIMEVPQKILIYTFSATPAVSGIYLMDLFRFCPKFGPYHYERLPRYKRVKWAQLAGPSQILNICCIFDHLTKYVALRFDMHCIDAVSSK